MNNIKNIFSFELKNQLKKKSFIISNIIMVVIILLLTSIPTIAKLFNGGEGDKMPEEAPTDIEEYPSDNGEEFNDVALYYDDSVDEDILLGVKDFSMMKKVSSTDEIENLVRNEDVDYGVAIEEGNLKIYTKNESFSSDFSGVADSYNKYINSLILTEKGIDPKVLDSLETHSPYPEVISLEKSSAQNFIVGYIGIFILYFILIMYGNQTATSVANEKSNRTMEILITTTNAKSLIVGKVLAGMALSFIQVLVLTLALIIGLKLNMSNYPMDLLSYISLNITPDVLITFLIFTILGVCLYLFIYAAGGALVSKVEDLASAITPVQILVIIGFAIAMGSLTGSPDSKLMVIGSYIPFTSPYLMFLRYAVFGVSMGELLLSIGILVVSIILIAFISIRIYRNATLNYGNRLKMFSEIRKAFSKKN